MSHLEREPLAARHPVYVTIEVKKEVPPLRTEETHAALRSAFAAGRERSGFRLIHYSVQDDRLHFIAEAKDRVTLARGMQGLLIRVARGLNRVWGRKGSVFADRYDARPLRTPKEVRDALLFVLNNTRRTRRHGARGHGRAHRGLDPYASGQWFDGWRDGPKARETEETERPVAPPRTWLLTEGWRRHGLLGLDEAPPPAG